MKKWICPVAILAVWALVYWLQVEWWPVLAPITVVGLIMWSFSHWPHQFESAWSQITHRIGRTLRWGADTVGKAYTAGKPWLKKYGWSVAKIAIIATLLLVGAKWFMESDLKVSGGARGLKDRGILFWVSLAVIGMTILVALLAWLTSVVRSRRAGRTSQTNNTAGSQALKPKWNLGNVLAISSFWIGLFLLVFQFKKDWLEWLIGHWPMIALTALIIVASVIAGGLAKPQDKKKGTTISGVLLTWFGGATALYLVFFVALPSAVSKLEDSSRAVRGINTNTAPTSAPARAENWRTKESFTIVAPTNGWVTVKVRYGEGILWKRLDPAPVHFFVNGKMFLVQPNEIAPRVSGNQFRFSSATNREVPILVEILVKE